MFPIFPAQNSETNCVTNTAENRTLEVKTKSKTLKKKKKVKSKMSCAFIFVLQHKL